MKRLLQCAAPMVAALAMAGCGQLLNLDDFAGGAAPTGGGTTTGGNGGHGGSSGGAGSGGGPACMPPMQMCGDHCVDTASDGLNCGKCGKDCLGGACAEEQCQPLKLADGDAGGMLTLSEDDVFWTSPAMGSVSGISKDGSSPTAIKSDADVPGPIAAASDIFVFWHEAGTTNTFFRANQSGTNATELLTMGGEMHDIYVDDDHIYFTRDSLESSGGGVYRRLKAGSDTTLLTLPMDNPRELAGDQGGVYVTRPQDDTLERIDKVNPSWIVPIASTYAPTAPRADDSHVYWRSGDGHIVRLLTPDGSAVGLLSNQDGSLLAIDHAPDGRMYWTHDKAIRSADKAGAEPFVEVLANPEAIVELEVDDEAIYWLDGAGLWKLAKP